MDNNPMKIDGGKVRTLREAKSWSQEHLAAAAGVSARTVQRIESDGVGSAESKLALAGALGVSVGELTPPVATATVRGGRPRLPGGAWAGWTAGALCSVGAVLYNHARGNLSAGQLGQQLGVLSALLGTTLGVMGALNGWLHSRGPSD